MLEYAVHLHHLLVNKLAFLHLSSHAVVGTCIIQWWVLATPFHDLVRFLLIEWLLVPSDEPRVSLRSAGTGRLITVTAAGGVFCR